MSNVNTNCKMGHPVAGIVLGIAGIAVSLLLTLMFGVIAGAVAAGLGIFAAVLGISRHHDLLDRDHPDGHEADGPGRRHRPDLCKMHGQSLHGRGRYRRQCHEGSERNRCCQDDPGRNGSTESLYGEKRHDRFQQRLCADLFCCGSQRRRPLIHSGILIPCLRAGFFFFPWRIGRGSVWASCIVAFRENCASRGIMLP